jgi:hypothetical protein
MLNTSEHWINAIDFIGTFEINIFKSWHNTRLTLPQITSTIKHVNWDYDMSENASKIVTIHPLLHLKIHP